MVRMYEKQEIDSAKKRFGDFIREHGGVKKVVPVHSILGPLDRFITIGIVCEDDGRIAVRMEGDVAVTVAEWLEDF